MNNIKAHLITGIGIAIYTFYIQNCPEVIKPTLCNKGFTMLLSNQFLITAWIYRLKPFISYNFWKKLMRVQFVSIAIIFVGRSIRLIQYYYF